MKRTTDEDAVRCIRGIDAAELEKAWREGYALGYERGSDDATAYEWGTARGPKTKARNEEEEWIGSETKASTGLLTDCGHPEASK